MSRDTTTVETSVDTADILADYKQRGDSYNDVIKKLIREHQLFCKTFLKDKMTSKQYIKKLKELWDIEK